MTQTDTVHRPNWMLIRRLWNMYHTRPNHKCLNMHVNATINHHLHYFVYHCTRKQYFVRVNFWKFYRGYEIRGHLTPQKVLVLAVPEDIRRRLGPHIGRGRGRPRSPGPLTKFVGSSVTAFSCDIISSRIWDFCDQDRNYSGALKNYFTYFLQLKCTYTDLINIDPFLIIIKWIIYPSNG